MIQPKIQEVLLPIKEVLDNNIINHIEKRFTDFATTHYIVRELNKDFKSTKLITFTPEEFETFKREFGKELLEKAADNAKLGYDKVLWDDPKEGDDAYMNIPKVDKESILNTLDEHLLNNKI